MRNTLVPGVRGERHHRVVTENLVNFRRPGAPAVLCTPWLLHVMEWAACDALTPHLDSGETSVGYRFKFEHLTPTPAGDTVVAVAIVRKIDGKMVHLDFEARDSQALVARGKHVRAIIDQQRFMQGLRDRQVTARP